MRLAPSIIPQLFSSSHDLDWCLVMKILSKETSTNKAKLFSLFYIQLFCLILMSSSSPSVFFLSLCGDDKEMVAKMFFMPIFFPGKKLSHLPPYFIGLYYIPNQNEQLFFLSLSLCVFFLARNQPSSGIRKARRNFFIFVFCFSPE